MAGTRITTRPYRTPFVCNQVFFSGNCCQATLDFLRDLEDSSQLSCKTPISVNPYSIQCEMASLESKKKHKGCSTESILHVHIFKCCFQRFETYFSQLCQVATLTSISQCTSKIKKIQKIKRSKRSKDPKDQKSNTRNSEQIWTRCIGLFA